MLRYRPRSRLPIWLAAVAAVSLGAATPAPSQQTPTPEFLQKASSQCAADARIKYDVTSIPEADGVHWQVRRGTPGGSLPSWASAEQIDQGQTVRVDASRSISLRDYGATLNGTPYLARVRATQAGNPVADWSEPASYTPTIAATTAMFTATPVTTGPTPQFRLQWSLGDGLEHCADRMRYEIKKGSPFSSPTAQDPNTFMAETFTGTSGDQTRPMVGGPGDYYVRILARYGADDANHDVGLRSPAVKITFPATVTTYALDVTVLDGAASVCANAQAPRGNATVQVTGSGVSLNQSTDAQGRAHFSVPAGSYTVQASHQDCRSAQAVVNVMAGTQQALTLSNCGATTLADLAVSLGGASNPLGGRPYALPTKVRNQGTARALAGQLAVQRTAAGGGTTVLLQAGFPNLCPGEERSYSAQDPSPVAGQTYSYSARASVTDANAGNNVATRTVSFSYEATASQPVAEDPSGPTTLPLQLAISSFAVRNGLPYVSRDRLVPLTVTATGDPTEYRAALRSSDCSTSLGSASWRTFSASTAPTWSFTTTGNRTVCFQLRRGGGNRTLTQVSSIREDAIGVVDAVWTSAQLGSTTTTVVPPGPLPPPTLPVVLSCNSRFAVGVDLRAGIYVDAIALRCADLGPAGEHSNVVNTEFVGGSGGTRVSLRCNSGEVLTRLAVRYGAYVDRLTVGCRPWRRDSGTSGSTRIVGSAGGQGGDQSAVGDCPRPLSIRSLQNLLTRNSFVATFQTVCTVPPGL